MPPVTLKVPADRFLGLYNNRHMRYGFSRIAIFLEDIPNRWFKCLIQIQRITLTVCVGRNPDGQMSGIYFCCPQAKYIGSCVFSSDKCLRIVFTRTYNFFQMHSSRGPGFDSNTNGIAMGPSITPSTPQNTGFAFRCLAIKWQAKPLSKNMPIPKTIYMVDNQFSLAADRHQYQFNLTIICFFRAALSTRQAICAE